MGTEATKQRLVEATLAAISDVGFSGLSARVIARRAKLAQGLIFYHYGSMEALIAESCRSATAHRVAVWTEDLDAVRDLPGLVALARRLHTVEAAEGNVTVLAQALAAAQTDDTLAPVVGEALGQWLVPLEATAKRILKGTVLDGVLAPVDVARAVAAAFVGVELFDGVVPDAASDPFDMLERMAVLGALVLEAGPITKAAVRRRLRTVGS